MSATSDRRAQEQRELQQFEQARSALREILPILSAPIPFSQLEKLTMEHTGLEKWPIRQAIWHLLSVGEISFDEEERNLIPT